MIMTGIMKHQIIETLGQMWPRMATSRRLNIHYTCIFYSVCMSGFAWFLFDMFSTNRVYVKQDDCLSVYSQNTWKRMFYRLWNNCIQNIVKWEIAKKTYHSDLNSICLQVIERKRVAVIWMTNNNYWRKRWTRFNNIF